MSTIFGILFRSSPLKSAINYFKRDLKRSNRKLGRSKLFLTLATWLLGIYAAFGQSCTATVSSGDVTWSSLTWSCSGGASAPNIDGSTFNGSITINGLNNGDNLIVDINLTITGNLVLNANGSPKLTIESGKTLHIKGNLGDNTLNNITYTAEAQSFLIVDGTLYGKNNNLFSGSGTITGGTLDTKNDADCIGSCPTISFGTCLGGSVVCSGSNNACLNSVGNDQTLCSGQTPFSLDGTPATTYNWQQSTDGVNFVNAVGTRTGQSYSPLALTQTMWYRRSVTKSGCTSPPVSNVIKITLASPTLATSAISGSPFCAGASVSVPFTTTCDFTAGNVFTAQLSNASGSFASPTNIGTLTSTTSGTLSATLPTGIATGTGYRIRVVGSSPSVTGTTSATSLTINSPSLTTAPTNQVRCGTGTVTLNGVPASGSSLEWSTTAAFTTFSTGNSYTTASITAPNTITIYYRASRGSCKGTVSSVTATAGAIPAVPTVPAPGTICAGATATITPNTQSGVLFNFYTVSSGGTALNASPAASYDVAPTSSTTYYVESVNTTTDCRSTSRRSVTVSVNAAPTAFNVTGGGAFCLGNSGISVGLSGSQVSVLGGTIFLYQLQNIGVNVGSAVMGWGFPINFGNQTAAGIYTVVATNLFTGCSQTMNGSATLTINPIPATPTAGSNTPVCIGSSISLSTVAVTGATYSWTGPNGYTSSQQNPTISNATSSMAGTYSLTVTVNGCTSAAGTTNVTIRNRPTASISGNATICSGSATNLSIALTGTQPWSVTYTNGTTPTTVSGITSSPYVFSVSPSSTATYSLTAVSDANCTGTTSGSAIITVNPLPGTPGSITGTSQVCQNTNTITYTVTAISNTTQYIWSLPTGARQSVTNATGTVTTNTNSITLDFTSTSVSGNITVNGRNSCGNGPTVSRSVTVSTSGTWLGGSSDDWNNSANWCGGVPTASTNVTITAATSPTNWPVIKNTPNALSNHLTINSGASLTMSGNFTLDVYGNFTNNGTFTSGTGTVRFRSSSATQNISGTTTFNNLTISDGATKTLGSDVTVNGLLTLQSGLLSTGSNKVILANSAANAVSGSTTAYVDGNLQRAITGSGSYVWPIGSSGRYAPITVNIPVATPLAGTSRILGFFTYASPGGTNTFTLSESGNEYTSLCTQGYWTLTPDVQPSLGNFDLIITPPSGMTCSGTQSTIVKRPNSAGSWGFYGSTSSSTVRRNGFSSFSEVAQATGNSVSLPVRLLSFTAQLNQGNVDLKWITLSESNNERFEIERSNNLIDFETIAQVKGAGTTSERKAYSYTDQQPLPGFSYYRLRQVDVDGHFTFSAPIAIDNTNAQLRLEVFPNPIPHGNDIQVKITTSQATSFSLDLYDLHGRRLHQEIYQAEAGVSQLTLKRHHTLPLGVYLLRIIPVNQNEGQPVRMFKLTVE